MTIDQAAPCRPAAQDLALQGFASQVTRTEVGDHERIVELLNRAGLAAWRRR